MLNIIIYIQLIINFILYIKLLIIVKKIECKINDNHYICNDSNTILSRTSSNVSNKSSSNKCLIDDIIKSPSLAKKIISQSDDILYRKKNISSGTLFDIHSIKKNIKLESSIYEKTI